MAFDKLRKAGSDEVDEVKHSFWLSLLRSMVCKDSSEGPQDRVIVANRALDQISVPTHIPFLFKRKF